VELGLQGRIALITGASAGLGRAAAMTLAAEGAQVAIVARDPARLEATADDLRARFGADAVLAVAGDVSRAEDVAVVVATVQEHFGGVDILVNNAGRMAGLPFLEVDDAEWQADLDLKLFGAIRLVRACVPSMRERGGGRIVNVLAIAEFAPDGILVNAVLIGLVKSDQWIRRWEAGGGSESLEAMYAGMAAGIPVGRVGEAEEFADLVAFLVSARAGFITGVGINFDGGMAVGV